MGAHKIPGTDITVYGKTPEEKAADPGPLPAARTPLSQGTGGAPPTSNVGGRTIPGSDVRVWSKPKTPASTSTPEDSQGDGTWTAWLHDFTHNQPANLNRPQTWRDWFTKSYSPAMGDVGRAALDDFTLSAADPIRAYVTGENLADLRARTADSQAAMGPLGPVLNAATYMAPGLGESKLAYAVPGRLLSKAATKVAPKIGRYTAAAAEGGTAAATRSIDQQVGSERGVDPVKVLDDAKWGTIYGLGGQAGGDALTTVARPAANAYAGLPGRSRENWGPDDWRARAAVGDSTVSPEVADELTYTPPGPRRDALNNLRGALAQSTDPGPVATATGSAVGAGVAHVVGGADKYLDAFGLALPLLAKQRLVDWPARQINTVDRNINVGNAFDQLYPQMFPGRGPSTVDTSGWADALRSLTIGAQNQFVQPPPQ
jgi:hypothetical protein